MNRPWVVLVLLPSLTCLALLGAEKKEMTAAEKEVARAKDISLSDELLAWDVDNTKDFSDRLTNDQKKRFGPFAMPR